MEQKLKTIHYPFSGYLKTKIVRRNIELTCVGLRQVRGGETEVVDGETEVQELV